MRQLLYPLYAALAIWLTACAAAPYAVPPGTPRDVAIQRAGAPTRIVRTEQGERLQYSYQPLGHEAWMVDLDSAGRVIGVYQALNEQNFNRIQPGWTSQDVEREFGPPAQVDRVGSWRGPVWTYRWRDVANTRMFYWVYLDERGVVGRAHPGIDFINGPDNNRH
jgi:hypothetical protein